MWFIKWDDSFSLLSSSFDSSRHSLCNGLAAAMAGDFPFLSALPDLIDPFGGDADKVHIWDLSTMLNKSTPRLSSPCDGGPHVLLLLLLTPQVMEHTLFAHLNEQHLHTFTGSRLQIWFWNTRTFVNTSHFGAVFFSTMPASCVMLNALLTLLPPLHFLFLHKWNFPLRIIWIIWDFSFYAFCIAHTCMSPR